MNTRAIASMPPGLVVPPPQNARRVAKLLVIFFIVFGIASWLAPWRQTVSGSGQVVAFTPDQRPQSIEAPVSGVVERWLVHEGSQVRRGDPIVELSDNADNLLSRLGQERSAVSLRLTAQEARVLSLTDRVASLRRSQRAEISAAEAEVRIAQEELASAEQRLSGEVAEQETNALNLRRQRDLQEQGLASLRDLELAELAARQSDAAVASAEAAARAARSRLASRRAALDRARAAADAEVQSAEAALSDAETSIASTNAELTRLDVGISRQSAQAVVAPVDGTILRVVARRGGDQVSQGETLALLVPDTADRAVQLFVDGNDAALIQRGAKVRLQFEGWPAVQFTGWPSVAVGTFGGEVAFVDGTDDGMGNFRVVLVPDSQDEPWPDPRYLRQGVRAKGWFLLKEVQLGWELWRRFNGFPPVVTPPTTTGSTIPGASTSGGEPKG